MNDTYIGYINELLDLAERKDFLCLTSKAFNEFAAEVKEALRKGKAVAPDIDPSGIFYTFECRECGTNVSSVNKYCHKCGQKLDWED